MKISHSVEIKPIGIENIPRLKSLFKKDFLEAVILKAIGITYDIPNDTVATPIIAVKAV